MGDATRNAGIVVLLVPRQEGRPGTGQIRVEVGRGLEGIVTDAAAGRIRDLMGERLARGDYSGALQLGVQALAADRARLRRDRHRAHQCPARSPGRAAAGVRSPARSRSCSSSCSSSSLGS